MPPSAVFLDVMNTLVYDPIEEEIPAFFDLSLKELYAKKHPTAWVDFELGELSEPRFYEIYFPDQNEAIDGRALRSVLCDAYRFLDGIEALLQRLADADTALYALSNYPVWFEIIEEKLKLSRYLRWDFVSWKTGVRKPDPQAYLGAAAGAGVAPEDCLFVDDRNNNCQAALDVGMDAIVFESAEELSVELEERGIL